MPSGISTQPLTLSKAPGKREKASCPGGGRSREPSAHGYATETAEHATNSSNTVQAVIQCSHAGSTAFLLLPTEFSLVIYVMPSNPLDRREETAAFQKHIPAAIIPIFPFKCAAPLPEIDHPTSTAHARNKWAKVSNQGSRYKAGNFICGPETLAAFPEGACLASYQSGFSSANSNISYDADSSPPQNTIQPTPYHHMVWSTGELARTAATRW